MQSLELVHYLISANNSTAMYVRIIILKNDVEFNLANCKNLPPSSSEYCRFSLELIRS